MEDVRPPVDSGGYGAESVDGVDRSLDFVATLVDRLVEAGGSAVRAATALVGPRCRLTGGTWWSYYDATTVSGPSGLDIDHVVPLAEAWDSGASAWTAQRREAYANDLGALTSLVGVTARSNRSKSDQDPTTWMPPVGEVHCQDAAEWTATKIRWNLAVDPQEEAELLDLAEQCPTTEVYFDRVP
ncbi:HNH endonuclease family protein [Streptomyces albidochromogenes]|uniref:HNH endonuclease family protein n=1 Tax=Streptomyces albidochromogenes TaxID=329524 RepID=UPI00110FE7C6|nr:HNH endonuclease family protein [Streptomyces albidochromogenes]